MSEGVTSRQIQDLMMEEAEAFLNEDDSTEAQARAQREILEQVRAESDELPLDPRVMSEGHIMMPNAVNRFGSLSVTETDLKDRRVREVKIADSEEAIL